MSSVGFAALAGVCSNNMLTTVSATDLYILNGVPVGTGETLCRAVSEPFPSAEEQAYPKVKFCQPPEHLQLDKLNCKKL